MSALYSHLVSELRRTFVQPDSGRDHDDAFVPCLLRSLGQADAMKSESPILGSLESLDFAKARTRRMSDHPLSLERVTEHVVEHLSGMFISGHPRAQINVAPSPTIPSIIGGLLPSLYNPNLVSDESSQRMAVAEIEAASIAADLVGYDAQRSGGVFTFGGTGTTLYGVKIGLEKSCPGTMHKGVRETSRIVCSECAHYAARTVAGWLGMGFDSIADVPTDESSEMRTCLLESMCRDLLKRGEKLAAIIATLGTTDAFGLDDLHEIVAVRDRLVDEFALDYVPHIHADAVIDWAWAVFNDYDFDKNPLEFPGRTLRALTGIHRRVRHLGLADSIGIDFHKTGFAPYVSSLFLVRDKADLARIAQPAASMPYLFKAANYHPGQFTLETSRPGGGALAALANLLLFGKNGMRAVLGHLVTMAETLRERLKAYSGVQVLNCGNFGPVTLFRVYPAGVDATSFAVRERRDPACRDKVREYNAYNRRIFEVIQAEAIQGRGVAISFTDCHRETDYGDPIVALKSYIMSPFSEVRHIELLVESIEKARKAAGDASAQL